MTSPIRNHRKTILALTGLAVLVVTPMAWAHPGHSGAHGHSSELWSVWLVVVVVSLTFGLGVGSLLRSRSFRCR